MDAGLPPTSPSSCPPLVRAVEAGADLAIGSRYVPGGKTKNWPAHRQILSRGANLYTRMVLGTSIKDITAGSARTAARPCSV